MSFFKAFFILQTASNTSSTKFAPVCNFGFFLSSSNSLLSNHMNSYKRQVLLFYNLLLWNPWAGESCRRNFFHHIFHLSKCIGMFCDYIISEFLYTSRRNDKKEYRGRLFLINEINILYATYSTSFLKISFRKECFSWL